MAKKDKMRYEEEMKNYTPPKGLGSPLSKKNSKGKKDPNAPKRPMTAFMLFSNATRAKMKEENPGISFGEVVSLIECAKMLCLLGVAYVCQVFLSKDMSHVGPL